MVVRPLVALRGGAARASLAGCAALARGKAAVRRERGAAERTGQLDAAVMKLEGHGPGRVNG